jgi:hypothetical protein
MLFAAEPGFSRARSESPSVEQRYLERDAVAHEIAVGLLDNIAQMNADAEFDASFGRKAFVALSQAILHLECTAHCVDYAAEFDQDSVAGALDHAPVMHGDGRIDKIAPERP